MKMLIILRAVSGAGKSSFARWLAGVWNATEEVGRESTVICSADDWFMQDGEYRFDPSKLGVAHQACFDKFCDAVKRGVGLIILDNTNTQEREFSKYVDWVKDTDYRITFLVVENRHGGVSEHNVPDAALDKMVQRFQFKLR